MNDVQKSLVRINKKNYKVINCILHHGKSIETGHYTSMIRQNNQWFEINDMLIKKRSWPRGAKDAYLLFLEEFTNK